MLLFFQHSESKSFIFELLLACQCTGVVITDVASMVLPPFAWILRIHEFIRSALKLYVLHFLFSLLQALNKFFEHVLQVSI